MDKFYVYALLDERKPGEYKYKTDDLNIKFKKKFTINRMKELEYMINFYGIK